MLTGRHEFPYASPTDLTHAETLQYQRIANNYILNRRNLYTAGKIKTAAQADKIIAGTAGRKAESPSGFRSDCGYTEFFQGKAGR